MGRVFLIGLEGSCYSCKYCSAHLALRNDIISKSFQCNSGKAYLFENVVNVTAGTPEMRSMLTGNHIVSDIYCVGCGSIVGWKYLAAFVNAQKYKEGKFILERSLLLGPDGKQPEATQYLITHDGMLEESAGEDSV